MNKVEQQRFNIADDCFFFSVRNVNQKYMTSSTGGTLSTSEDSRRKSSILVIPEENINRPESLAVMKNKSITENNNGGSKPELDGNRSSKRVKYTTKSNNGSFNLNRKKPVSQSKGIILEDLELQ